MNQADVLIVGAGPAGSIAALALARAGVNVQLVDRARFPRDKLCGDTLNPGALSILDRLGVSQPIRSRALRIDGMKLTGPRGTTVTGEYPANIRGLALIRRELDTLLLEAAAKAGAKFEPEVVVRSPIVDSDRARVTGVRVSVGGVTRDWGARLIIAADGRHSTLGFKLGLSSFAPRPRRWAFGAYFENVEGLTTLGEMHIRPDGYVGVAPLPGGIVNVCVVRERQRREGPPQGGHYVRFNDTIEAIIASDSVLKDKFARARQVTTVTSLGPLAIESRGAGCPGLVLAGDAAGFIDPMTGDGLRFALRGGELAAQAALKELATGTPAFATLSDTRAAEFSRKWRLNRALRAVVDSRRALECLETLGAHWSAPFRYLVTLAGDVGLARHNESMDLLPIRHSVN